MKDFEYVGDIRVNFSYLFEQKVALVRHSGRGFVFFPGGPGTHNILFEILCLMQTQKMEKKPLVLVGKQYWNMWYEWMKEVLVTEGVISPEDLLLFRIVDSSEEAIDKLENYFRSSSSPLSFIDKLSSRDKLEVEKGLKLLDEFVLVSKDYKEAHRILEEVMQLKEITPVLNIINNFPITIEIDIFYEKRKLIGSLKAVLTYGFDNKPYLKIVDVRLFDEFVNKRIFRLIYRWFATESECVERFGGFSLGNDIADGASI